MSRQPLHVQDLLDTARRLIQANDRDQARRLLNDLLAADPDNLEAWGLLLRLTDNYREEMVYLRQILARSPGLTWAQERLDQLVAYDLDPDADLNWGADDDFGVDDSEWLGADQEEEEDQHRRIPLWILMALLVAGCLIAAVVGIFLVRSGNEPQQSSVDCEQLISNALSLTDTSCNQIDSNQACYGNIRLEAELNPGAPSSFDTVGDVIDVQNLRSLSASPMDLENQVWGVALFKLEANIAYTSPGELATFIVFGDTNLTNESGDMQAFYFSSGFGKIVCESIPFDGIYVTMPDGAGLTFSVNGTQVTLFGDGLIEAHEDGEMVFSVTRGSGEVEANGQSQPVGEGWSVGVPLDGLNPSGPPTAPEWIVKDVLTQSCAMFGIGCDPDDLDPVYPGGAEGTVVAGATEGARVAGGSTVTPTPIPTVRPGDPTYTPTPTTVPTVRPGDPTYTPTSTPVPTVRPGQPTYTPVPLPTNTLPPAPTATPVPPTNTPIPPTDTPVPTNTPVPPPTDTPLPSGSCDWSTAGDGSFSITNNTTTTVNMTYVTVNGWPASSGKLIRVMFGAAIWAGQPSDPPVGFSPLTPASLNQGQSGTLELNFQNAPGSSGYSVQVDFDWCSVSISN